jgi:hypothetical protein
VRTWQFEIAVVAVVLGTIAAITGGPVEWVGAGAVTLSFAHAQVADRLAEREATRPADDRAVTCHRWATRYLVGKETLWLAYFVLHRSWTALAGVGLFLAYPAWRRFWRRSRPLGRTERSRAWS